MRELPQVSHERHDPAGIPTGRRTAGVTLLELLLVLAILAIMLGGGLGVFAALDVGKRQAVGIVKSVVRSAQNEAIATQSPARVRIDPATGALWTETLRAVGTWHFEDEKIDGAFGLDGGMRNCAFISDGYLGDALCFGGTGSFAEVQVNHDPAWDFRDGFAIDIVLLWDGGAGGKLLRIGKSIGIEIGGRGEVNGWFQARLEEGGRVQMGGTVSARTAEGMIPNGRWTRVRLDYDRRRLAIFVDGAAVQVEPAAVEVWKVEGALVLSDPSRPFPGCVDALVVCAVVASEVINLPETVRFQQNTPPVIHFDAGGALDRREHLEPIALTVEFEDGSQESIAVGTYGTVE